MRAGRFSCVQFGRTLLSSSVQQVAIAAEQQGSLQADSHRGSLEVLPGTGADAPAHQRVTFDPLLTRARLSGVPEANIKSSWGEAENILKTLWPGRIWLCFGIIDAGASKTD